MSEKESIAFTLLINKPLGWTSFDVVNKLRYAAKSAFGVKKLKVGHAGTLDPLATGLMIVCFGRHTKTIDAYVGLNKSYEGKLQLGATTPSFDLETEIDQRFPLPNCDTENLLAVAQRFVGSLAQVPPIYSAKKQDGKKAYTQARKGKSLEMKPSLIHIYSFDIESSAYPTLGFKVNCSKGTYIRSLVHDYGAALGLGAHLTMLHRTRIGDLNVKQALSIEDAIMAISQMSSNSMETKALS